MREIIIAQGATAITAQQQNSTPTGQPTTTQSQTALLYSASASRLFLHGVASNRIWLILATIYGLSQQGMLGELLDRLRASVFQNISASSYALMIWIPAIMLGLLCVSGVLSLLRYYDYALRNEEGRLSSTAGMLNLREEALKKEKVTGLVFRQTVIGRPFDLWSLLVRQAASTNTNPVLTAPFMVPGLRQSEFTLANQVMNGVAPLPSLQGVSPAMRRIFWIRLLLPLLLLLMILGWLWGMTDWRTASVALLMPLLAVMIHLRWIHWAWALDDEKMWVRHGLLGRTVDCFPIRLVQHVCLQQNPYQRRHGLATLLLTLPQGTIIIPFMAFSTASDIANRVLYVAESANSHRL
ncbi:MAG: PH domain-containing protein [Pseudomonadales bacterium]|nr:PH domain-containing protein [Pseudomonadales bacterium]